MRRRRNSGQAAIEAALSLTGFALVVFGILDVSRGFWTWQSMANIAGEGTRWAIVHGSDSGMTMDAAPAQLTTYLQGRFGSQMPAGTSVTLSYPDGDNDPGDTARVVVAYNFQPSTPVFGSRTIPLTGISEMAIIR